MTQVPVGLPADTVRCACTPSAVRVAATSRPKGSSPMQPTNVTGKPEEPSQAAVIAAEPPGWMLMRAGVSLA